MSLLALDDVQKRFGHVEALRGVTFAIEAGSVVGLVGDNGAGKSTLMKCITGIYRADAGSISFDGAAIDGLEPGAIRARGIEMIYQDLALAPQQDVASNIFLGREPTRSFLGLPLGSDRPGPHRARGGAHDRAARRAHPVGPLPGRPALGRPAAVGRDRPGADLRAQARDHGRADRSTRGARGRPCARADPASCGARASPWC